MQPECTRRPVHATGVQKTYLNRWAERHPTPYDFMYTSNDVSGQNLNWFWQKWVFGYGYAELAISGLEGTTITVENLGGMPRSTYLEVEL